MADWVMGRKLQVRVKCDLRHPKTTCFWFCPLVTSKEENQQVWELFLQGILTGHHHKERRQPPTSVHGCDCNLEHPPLPAFSCSTPHWFGSLAAVSGWRHLHIHTLSLHSSAPAWKSHCFYLAGFQDVDLLLVYCVPVLLQKPLTLVLHLPGHKEKKLRGPSPNTQGQGAPTTPLLLGAHPKNWVGRGTTGI